MTTRIELRKEQQRQVTTNTPSIGFAAGEMATRTKPIWNPGPIWLSGTLNHKGFFNVQKNFSVRAVGLDSVIVPTDLSTTTDTNAELTFSVRQPSVELWKKVVTGDDLTVEPNFTEFKSKPDLKEVQITLNSGTRQGTTITNIIRTPTYQTITYDEVLPTWGSPVEIQQFPFLYTQDFNSFATRCRVVWGGSSSTCAYNIIRRFVNLSETTKFKDSDLFSNFSSGVCNGLPRGTSFHTESSKSKEKYRGGSIELFFFNNTIRAYGYLEQIDGRVVIHTGYPQLSGYLPSITERVSTGSTTSTVNSKVPPPDVYLSAQFLDGSDTVLHTDRQLVPNIGPTNQTLTFNYSGTSRVAKVKLVIGDEYKGWILNARVKYPRTFSNESLDTYCINSDRSEVEDIVPVVYGHASPIDVPDIATLAGTRPNEYLTYSGTWDGSTFQSMRCRCPAWILYHVLTAERFGIELPTSRINTQSFLTASKYCQALINSKPRWSYDGPLQGTQSKIIRDLLNLMRGWLRNDVDGRLSLKIEQPEEARWIICPAVIGQGRIDYRRSLERPTVRCTYTNRLTGQEAATAGLENARIVEVPWQDPDIAQRWADWETFNDQNLLDSVEFTLPWRYHSIGIGDLIDLYDPQHIGLRPAGRILDFDATGKWVQLDGVPNYWPDKEASASLKDYGRKTVINPDVWGFSTFSFTGANPPSVQIQTSNGGYTSHAIKEVMFSAGGRPEQNRVILDTFPSNIEDRATWAIAGKIDGDVTEDIHPTKWRIQSITENDTGKEFKVVCTRYIDGMHNFIEAGVALPDIKTKWKFKCGTNLSQYDGFFNDLEQRYPADNTNPFDLSTTFSNLPSSCVL